MKKSHIKLLIFNTSLIIFFLLSNLFVQYLNYINWTIFLIVLLILFKFVFGFERDHHRYIKDVVVNILIVLLSFFIVYYLFGLLIGFIRTTNYYTLPGMTKMILPFIAVCVLKEYLRYQMLNKAEGSSVLSILTIVLFIVMDLAGNIHASTWSSHYQIFIFFAVVVFPAVSRNLACTYIARKVGYKPNLLWVLVLQLYGSLLPIVPNTGVYVGSMINFLLPMGILYNTYSFLMKRNRDVPSRDKDVIALVSIPFFISFIVIVLYFTSGYFRYYSIAIASGSMTPNIYKGDVVIIDQKYDLDHLKIGDIIAYKYEERVVVHRLVDRERVGDEWYFYTKGDANNCKDSYIVYQDTIIGVVEYKLSYLGLPTVWINEL